MPTIKTVGVISKPNSPAAVEIVPKLFEWLKQRGISRSGWTKRPAYMRGRKGIPREDVPEGCDLIIVLGGDGTLLSAARAIGRREIPLFPVNLGGLGFLTAITVDEMFPELERALRGEHRVAKRKLLNTEVMRDGKLVASYRCAERRRAHEGRDRAHDRPGRPRGRPVRVRLQGRRADHLYAHGVDGIFAFGGRAHHFPFGAGASASRPSARTC